MEPYYLSLVFVFVSPTLSIYWLALVYILQSQGMYDPDAILPLFFTLLMASFASRFLWGVRDR